MHRAKRAFTLIELLVVISIIALLIAILLPVLGKARRSAQFMQCIAQLQHFAQASASYTTDNAGIMVHSNWGPNSGGWLYADGKPGSWKSPGSYSNFDQRRAMRKTGKLWKYMGQEGQSYYCPTDEGPFDNDPKFSFATPVRAMTSYQFNGGVTGYGDKGLPPGRIAWAFDELRNDTIIMWECDATTPRTSGGFWNDGGNRADEGLEIRHVDGAPVASIDGSAERIGHEDFYDMALHRGAFSARKPNALWYNPLTKDGH